MVRNCTTFPPSCSLEMWKGETNPNTSQSFVVSFIEASDGIFYRYVRGHLLLKKQKWSNAFRPAATLQEQSNTNFVETTHRILKLHKLNNTSAVLRSIFSVLLQTGYWMESRVQKYAADCRNKMIIGVQPQTPFTYLQLTYKFS